MTAVLDRPTTIRPATKQEFIDALRSGKYEQCRGSMQLPGNKVCAVGLYHIISGDGKFNALMGASNILGIPIGIYARIFDLNDSGKTFSELADLFETNLSDDFKTFSY